MHVLYTKSMEMQESFTQLILNSDISFYSFRKAILGYVHKNNNMDAHLGFELRYSAL